MIHAVVTSLSCSIQSGPNAELVFEFECLKSSDVITVLPYNTVVQVHGLHSCYKQTMILDDKRPQEHSLWRHIIEVGVTFMHHILTQNL